MYQVLGDACAEWVLTLSRCTSCQLIGFEFCEPAVLDARKNAVLNGVSNATFVVGTAESTFAAVAKEPLASDESEYLAVVDPPRAGLHNNVIKVLRVCRNLKRFVYVSCNPTGSFIEDAIKYVGNVCCWKLAVGCLPAWARFCI